MGLNRYWAIALIALTGCGSSGSFGRKTASGYEVDLSWNAPTDSQDPVAGYKVYRSKDGTSYEVINSGVDPNTVYFDTTIANGTQYDYYVTSVDAQGNESAPSNIFTVTIPSQKPATQEASHLVAVPAS